MTAEIINLNKVRKARARAERAAQAAENRLKFGRSKAERAEVAAEGEKLKRGLDGTRRDAPPATTNADEPSRRERGDADDLDPGTVA